MKTSEQIIEEMNSKLSGCTMSKFLSVSSCMKAREEIIKQAFDDSIEALKEYEATGIFRIK